MSSGEVISKAEITDRLRASDSRRLFITPLVSELDQVHETGIDLRLGPEFILFRRSKSPVLDPLEIRGLETKIQEFQEKVYVEVGHRLILHPQQMVLGSTLEYVRLPKDLMGYMAGRSSWGGELKTMFGN